MTSFRPFTTTARYVRLAPNRTHQILFAVTRLTTALML